MNIRSLTGAIITWLLVVTILFVILTQIFGFPAPLTYVETGSMEPTIQTGDGFVGIPAPLAGELSEGDIITFRAEVIQGGGLTTHRIVNITSDGYKTQGDANPVTDQEGSGEPLVKDPQIELVVLQINDQPVTIPHLGTIVLTTQSLLGGIAGALGFGGTSAVNTGLALGVGGLIVVVVATGYDMLTSSNQRLPSRSIRRPTTVDSRLILLALLIAVSLPLMSIMAIPSGTDEISILSTSFEANENDPTQIQAGSSSETQYTVENNQFFTKVVVVEPRSEGVSVSNRVLEVRYGETVETTQTLSAPEETGPHIRIRSEHHYLKVLPTPVILALHGIHPAVAMLSITTMFASPIVLVFYLSVGFRKISLREVSR